MVRACSGVISQARVSTIRVRVRKVWKAAASRFSFEPGLRAVGPAEMAGAANRVELVEVRFAAEFVGGQQAERRLGDEHGAEEVERRGGEGVHRFHVAEHHALRRAIGNLRWVLDRFEDHVAGGQEERRLVHRDDAVGAEAGGVGGAAAVPGFVGIEGVGCVEREPAGEARDGAVAGDADRRGPAAEAGKGFGGEEAGGLGLDLEWLGNRHGGGDGREHG